MNNKITINTKDYTYDIQDVSGTVYIHKTLIPDPKIFPGLNNLQLPELIFSGSSEEAQYIANALLQVTGTSTPFTPIEKDEIK